MRGGGDSDGKVTVPSGEEGTVMGRCGWEGEVVIGRRGQ